MKVLYHLTIRRPVNPAREAVWQEISLLRERIDGEICYLNPYHLPFRVPRLLYGFHKLRELKRREREFNVHHLYNPDPYPFPVIRWLERPVIYTLSGGLDPACSAHVSFFAKYVHTVVVSNVKDRERLAEKGLANTAVAPPGIDLSSFSFAPIPPPTNGGPRLMVGSAPWVRSQFRSKGIDVLLQAAASLPRLQLVFLWRDVLYTEMVDRVRRLGLEGRVEIINRQVDVNAVLAGVHASVVLAANPAIVKAYPHSLMESLAAGKPVLVSRGLPLADLVEEEGCGRVVEDLAQSSVEAAIGALVRDYASISRAARDLGQGVFSHLRTVKAYKELYARVGSGSQTHGNG